MEEFRSAFDRKTRTAWDSFGLKGLSGAMFLNKLVKHLPDGDEVSNELRKVIAVPADENEAREKLAGFLAFLEHRIKAGVTTSGELQPNRAPFLVSAFWHVQAPDVWPILYVSARNALQADRILSKPITGADGYLEFVEVFKAVADGLSIPLWELEHLCARLNVAKNEGDEAVDAEADDEPSQRQCVWLIAPGEGAKHFDEFYAKGIVAIGWDYLGDLSEYSNSEEIGEAIQQHRGGSARPRNDASACHQFAYEMKVGDIVFAKKGRTEIIGYGIVTSEYRYEPERQHYKHVRSVDWKMRGSWVPRDRPLVTKTLTEIGKYPGLVGDIRRALGIEEGEEPGVDEEAIPLSGYTIDDAIQEVFTPRAAIEEAVELLRYKKNLVLQGPPGVGKTFFAKRLAYLLLGEKDPDRIAQVQFHPSYSYEDFMQGYRPVDGGGFARVDGPFMRFCDQALQDSTSPYVLIIDEINRGNLSKIFGELLLLIEADKRSESWATMLTYSKEGEPPFYVPDNVYIIGTMNTADRSLALVDYALRRRFAFVDIGPGFENVGFARTLETMGASSALRDRIVRGMKRLNERIAKDPSLGTGFCIGHSYFCQKGATADRAWFERIVRTEIQPLLREYWFDQQERASEEIARLLDDG